MYIYIYTHIHTYMYIHIYIYIHTYTHACSCHCNSSGLCQRLGYSTRPPTTSQTDGNAEDNFTSQSQRRQYHQRPATQPISTKRAVASMLTPTDSPKHRSLLTKGMSENALFVDVTIRMALTLKRKSRALKLSLTFSYGSVRPCF